jgi:hypothetical protein
MDNKISEGKREVAFVWTSLVEQNLRPYVLLAFIQKPIHVAAGLPVRMPDFLAPLAVSQGYMIAIGAKNLISFPALRLDNEHA